MPRETDAQGFPNCPKSYVLKLETPGGPTSMLNGRKRLAMLPSSSPEELRRAEMLGHFSLPTHALLLRNHVGQDSNRVAEQ